MEVAGELAGDRRDAAFPDFYSLPASWFVLPKYFRFRAHGWHVANGYHIVMVAVYVPGTEYVRKYCFVFEK